MKRLITTIILLTSLLTGIAKEPEKGYRGFIDLESSVTSVRWYPDYRESLWVWGLSTSHGYQFNPKVFVGLGAMWEACTSYGNPVTPVYAHTRFNPGWRNIPVYGDLRVGYTFGDDTGIYISPAIGYRISGKRKAGLNISVGVTLQGYSKDKYRSIQYNDPVYGPTTELFPDGKSHTLHALFSLRLGVDF
ncbi:MAG: hypothetical protein K2J63_05055 [Muribaculaceae bacterium]|nr:hypothetical protein [Muribaculaceae bacterium]